MAIAQKKGWLSGEHFSVDGTLIQAWAGHKSFVRKDDDDQDGGQNDQAEGGSHEPSDKTPDSGASFKGEPRSNETHQSRSDPDSRLYCKGRTASELRYMGHTLSDNRHGLIASAVVTTPHGYAEREAAKAMLNDASQCAGTQITVGADKGYDAAEFVQACQAMNVVPHVAQDKSGRRSAVPDAIARARAMPSRSGGESS